MKIAFIDHHLNNYHADVFLDLMRNKHSDKGVEVVAAWESDPTGDDWCAKNGVKRAASIAEAMEAAEGAYVLAPDNIEDHLKLCEQVLPFGKPTAVDKFLAPTVKEADAIVALAKKHNARLQSASGLRYAIELEAALPTIGGQIQEASVRGYGFWPIYGIHTLAMATRLMGPGLKRVIDTGTAGSRILTMDYGDGRKMLIETRDGDNCHEVFSWRFAARSGKSYVSAEIKDFAGFYANLIGASCAFFAKGISTMGLDEARDLVAALEGSTVSQSRGGAWVETSELA